MARATTPRSASSATGSPDVGRNYERLTIEEFGAHLLDTGDLDPIYIALHKMELDIDTLSKWLVAYWCFYHAGVACHMASQPDSSFWYEMDRAAKNVEPAPNSGRWPRGHERRHFRGQQGIDAIFSLQGRYSHPRKWLEHLGISQFQSAPVRFSTIAQVVQQERGFGPWISFKVGDMMDRLDLLNVNFEQAEVFMFKDPVEAAIRVWRLKGGFADTVMPKDQGAAISQVVGYLRHHFKDYTAPPLHERPVDLQEVETVLCKWKSSCNGHYPPQNDTIEIRAGLEQWNHNEIARMMLGCMPTVHSDALQGRWPGRGSTA